MIQKYNTKMQYKIQFNNTIQKYNTNYNTKIQCKIQYKNTI